MAATIRSRSAWVASSNASNAARAARALERASARPARSSSRSGDVAVTVELLHWHQARPSGLLGGGGCLRRGLGQDGLDLVVRPRDHVHRDALADLVGRDRA